MAKRMFKRYRSKPIWYGGRAFRSTGSAFRYYKKRGQIRGKTGYRSFRKAYKLARRTRAFYAKRRDRKTGVKRFKRRKFYWKGHGKPRGDW